MSASAPPPLGVGVNSLGILVSCFSTSLGLPYAKYPPRAGYARETTKGKHNDNPPVNKSNRACHSTQGGVSLHSLMALKEESPSTPSPASPATGWSERQQVNSSPKIVEMLNPLRLRQRTASLSHILHKVLGKQIPPLLGVKCLNWVFPSQRQRISTVHLQGLFPAFTHENLKIKGINPVRLLLTPRTLPPAALCRLWMGVTSHWVCQSHGGK
jgi:hypothetical protein